MENGNSTSCTAFEGSRRIASGELAVVARTIKEVIDRGEQAPILIFDDVTGEQFDIDFRGTTEEVLKRIARSGGDAPADREGESQRGPGRPRLGVVAREVTLLPRHWEWLNSQPGGASVALRKLVEEARRRNQGKDRARAAQEAAYRFLTAMAGNFPDFEEVMRALFAGDGGRFDKLLEPWPADVRDHAKQLATAAFHNASEA